MPGKTKKVELALAALPSIQKELIDHFAILHEERFDRKRVA